MATDQNDNRPPSHNSDAERAVLGSMLRDNRVIDDVQAIIGQEDFYTDAHQRIFAAIVAIHGGGQPADLVTLANYLQEQKQLEYVGRAAYLAELWDAAPTAGNAEHYARIVKEKSTLRALLRAGGRIVDAARNPTGTAAEAVALAEQEVFAVAEPGVTGDVADAAQVVGEVFDHVDACAKHQGTAGGVLTGLIDVDAKTGGLHPSSLVLIAARPSVGKTALGAAIALRLVLNGHPVFFASLEQTRTELGERLLCSQARVDSHRLRKGQLGADETARLREAGEEIGRSPLWIDDGGVQTVLRIAANARRFMRRGGLAAVVIDYLQLVQPASRNPRAQRYEVVGEISRSLKALAKALGVPVVALCQLNRAPEGRADGKPRLSDLRESGSLEMDADSVWLLHRPEREPNVIDLTIGKNRNGPVGDVRLTYLPQWTRFENYAADIPFGGGSDVLAYPGRGPGGQPDRRGA